VNWKRSTSSSYHELQAHSREELQAQSIEECPDHLQAQPRDGLPVREDFQAQSVEDHDFRAPPPAASHLVTYNLVLYVDSEYKKVTDLPMDTLHALETRFESTYHMDDITYATKSEITKRNAYLRCIKPAGLQKLHERQECLNLRMNFGGKGHKADEKECCKKCLNNKRLCVQAHKIDGVMRLCLVPVAGPRRQGRVWTEEEFWCP
jgi:hypothetical protein